MAELNLIPYELRGKRGNGLDAKSTALALLLAVIIIGVAVVYPLVSYKMLQAEEKRLNEEIKINQAVLKEHNELTKAIVSYGQYIVMVEAITKVSPKVANRIRGIEKFMVGDIKFTNLQLGNGVNAPASGNPAVSIGSGLITISATSSSYNSITDFAANIQESEDYKDARITTISPNADKANYTFNITINY